MIWSQSYHLGRGKKSQQSVNSIEPWEIGTVLDRAAVVEEVEGEEESTLISLVEP